MITSLYAICLLVENLGRSLSFYRDILGLTVSSTDTGYVDFKLGDTLLGVFEKDAATMMFPKSHMTTGGGVVLAYQVSDVAKAYEELKARGVEIFEGPKEMPWGQAVAYFKDPDNNIWEITK